MIVWKTGHPIADTVAESLAEGFNGQVQNTSEVGGELREVSIAYGILRGTEEVFKRSNHWFNVDRGYTKPMHYDGNYRISYRGTQARWHEGIPTKPSKVRLEPWRKWDDNKAILICPPTEHVCKFFGLKVYPDRLVNTDWEYDVMQSLFKAGFRGNVRRKGSPGEIDWDKFNAVVTFNSSVGWKALAMGIPVLSDVKHSLIGSYYKCTDLKQLTDNLSKMPDSRRQLFEAMAAHEFTLQEIREGKAWPLVDHYLQSSSAGIQESQLPPKFAPTQLEEEPPGEFHLNT